MTFKSWIAAADMSGQSMQDRKNLPHPPSLTSDLESDRQPCLEGSHSAIETTLNKGRTMPFRQPPKSRCSAALFAIGLVSGLVAQAHATSFTINGITVSSDDAGFAQPSANTVHFPSAPGGVTTFTYGDGRGFTIMNDETSFGSSPSANIAGIPSAGGINAIAGFGGASLIVVKDAGNGTTLFSDRFFSLNGGAPWFPPALNFSYAGGTLTVNAIGEVQQINADGTVTYMFAADPSVLIGSYLLFAAGPSAADTQMSLQQSARKLRSVFNTAAIASNFANMNTYDCNLFDARGLCVSVGGRYTSVGSPDSDSSSSVLVLGYKASPQLRIGAFIDESFNRNTPGGIDLKNRVPLMGFFGVWNQNADGLGWQVKLANAYQSKDVDITRDVIGSSEAGKGSTELTAESYVSELSYAFNQGSKTLLRPYLAARYTLIKQDGYTERDASTPLTVAELKDRSTSLLAGIKVQHRIAPKAMLTGSLGVEQDVEHKVSRYTAGGIAGLTSESFNDDIKRTRAVASAGAFCDVARGQRLSFDVYYQELAFERTGSTTAYAHYTVGF